MPLENLELTVIHVLGNESLVEFHLSRIHFFFSLVGFSYFMVASSAPVQKTCGFPHAKQVPIGPLCVSIKSFVPRKVINAIRKLNGLH